jgi:diaminohydroxyphosphoribosylaminopyrimidine deaminase/5-amino-6-(5-phosphoribosylamino)uracil reductase
VVAGATDPNPRHAGAGFKLLRKAGVEVTTGVLEGECASLNEAFNHWIVHRTPFVIVKAAMTMDGKIATAAGESKWITGEEAREYGMRLRQGVDAILVGVNTVVADDPRLTVRRAKNGLQRYNVTTLQREKGEPLSNLKFEIPRRRIVLDTQAKTPLGAKVVEDEWKDWTTVVVGRGASQIRVKTLEKRVKVLRAPVRKDRIDIRWLLGELGEENVTSLLVEGGGEVNASFLLGRHAQRVAFFYAPKILGGRDAKKTVGGRGIEREAEIVNLEEVEWERVGGDLLLTGRIAAGARL